MIENALAESGAPGSVVSVVTIAVDRRDEIESGLGPQIVQAINAEIFARLKSITRAGEPLTERSGAAMALVMRNQPNQHDDIRLAQRLIDQFDPLVDIGGERFKVSLSIGIARQSAQQSNAGALLRQAEIALYEAQRLGGGRHLLYTPWIDDIFNIHSRIAQELSRAIEDNIGLSIVYQPIFDTAASELIGAEALLRWNHPVHGRLDRRLLIEIAESEGLITRLGDWVLDEVLIRLARSGPPWVAVNISDMQLRDPQFVDRLALRLEQMRLAPERLRFELAPEPIRDASLSDGLARLRNLGVGLVLDAFETQEQIVGLSDWRSFPFDRVDEIKLSARLAPLPGHDFGLEAALWGIAGHARANGVGLTAKNVETQAQHNMFSRLGISRAQGLFYAPPTTALTLETLAKRPALAG